MGFRWLMAWGLLNGFYKRSARHEHYRFIFCYVPLKFKEMNEQEMKDYYLGNDEVELTEELIVKLVKEKKWGDVESLKEMQVMGAKWNVIRDSVVFPTEFF